MTVGYQHTTKRLHMQNSADRTAARALMARMGDLRLEWASSRSYGRFAFSKFRPGRVAKNKIPEPRAARAARLKSQSLL